MQPAHNAGQKRRDEIAAPGSDTLDRPGDEVFHTADLDFNVEKGRARIAVKHIFQAWGGLRGRRKAFPQLLERVAANQEAVQPRIVADDGLPGAGAANVKFEAVSAVFESKIEGGDCVFRRVEAGA